MNKSVILTGAGEVRQYLDLLRESAAHVRDNLRKIMNGKEPLGFMYKIKFNPIGCNPLAVESPLNFIEQVNQTFTYWASFKAADFLFAKHKGLKELTLNLGTTSGSDIENTDFGIAAEVFAAVNPGNNQKLNKDIEKVSQTGVKYKYVFFMCPNYKEGVHENKNGIIIYSVGIDL